MKDTNELNKEERELILSILKEFNHQELDYSDVELGNIIYANSFLYKSYMPLECRGVSPSIKIVLDSYCEYGFLERGNGPGQYKITEIGLKFLRKNV